ncbi:MAG: AraC family ligand binding domain-containing protein [Patescibacteria group bacterium]|nr:AraC family ligand binding domain-containing protein [Patescibacteria group bacterium]
MHYKKYRWSKDYEAAEEELELLLEHLGHKLSRWEAVAYEALPPQQQPAARQLWCAEGSLQLAIAGQTVSLQPGDAITIEPNEVHSILAGVAGCVCYEALE